MHSSTAFFSIHSGLLLLLALPACTRIEPTTTPNVDEIIEAIIETSFPYDDSLIQLFSWTPISYSTHTFYHFTLYIQEESLATLDLDRIESSLSSQIQTLTSDTGRYTRRGSHPSPISFYVEMRTHWLSGEFYFQDDVENNRVNVYIVLRTGAR